MLLYYMIVLLALSAFSHGIHLLEKRNSPKIIAPKITKRGINASDISLNGIQNSFFYSFTVAIGNPPQSIDFVFDASVRNIVVNSAGCDMCVAGNCTMGSYNSNSSSNWQFLNDELMVMYDVGGGTGSWVKETITIGGTSIAGYQIGVLLDSNETHNYFGFGHYLNPVGYNPPTSTLQGLYKAGAINSASIAIRLADPPSMIFGAVDRSMYLGELVSIPMGAGGNGSLAINLTSVQFGISGQCVNSADVAPSAFPAHVLLDTGRFDSRLPQDLVNAIYNYFNIADSVVHYASGPYSFVPCVSALDQVRFNVSFGRYHVSIPASTLVYQIPADIANAVGIMNDIPQGYCMFAINGPLEHGNTGYTLGSSFLHHVYYVMDQGSNEVGLAALNPEPGPPKIQEIAGSTTGLGNLAITPGLVPATAPASEAPTRLPAVGSIVGMIAGALIFGVILG